MSKEQEQLKDEHENLGLYARWWHRLTDSSVCRARKWQPLPASHKAILKRCKNLEEVMLSEPFLTLWQMVPEEQRSPKGMELSALTAWSLSFVKQDDRAQRLAKTMAQRVGEGSDRPKVSTLRFQQLIKSRNAEQFARQLRRILPLIGGVVSVQDLAWEINNWYWQHQSPEPEINPAKRQVLRWAMDYYAAVPKS